MGIDANTINCWRINYGLNDKSPEEAMRWWDERLNGMAPAGAVAALGLALDELARLTKERDELSDRLRIRQLPDGSTQDDIDRLMIDLDEQHAANDELRRMLNTDHIASVEAERDELRELLRVEHKARYGLLFACLEAGCAEFGHPVSRTCDCYRERMESHLERVKVVING